jgi:hypothetical protein
MLNSQQVLSSKAIDFVFRDVCGEFIESGSDLSNGSSDGLAGVVDVDTAPPEVVFPPHTNMQVSLIANATCE